MKPPCVRVTAPQNLGEKTKRKNNNRTTQITYYQAGLLRLACLQMKINQYLRAQGNMYFRPTFFQPGFNIQTIHIFNQTKC